MKRPVRYFYRWLLLIAAAAFFWRIGAAWEIASGPWRSTVFTPSHQTDLCTYMELARAILAGHWPSEFYYQPFYYAVFLPFCYLLGGGSVEAVILIQSLLGAGTVWLAGLAAAQLGGRRAGLLAAGLTAPAAPLVLYAPFHQIATLQCFWLTLLFYLLLQGVRRPHWGWFAGAGAVAGAAILTRGNVLLLLPPILWGTVRHFSRKHQFRNACAYAALLLAVLLLTQLPFAAYNTLRRGKLSGPSTAANAVLALGNTPEAPAGGREAGVPAGPMEYPQCYAEWMADAARVPVIVQIWEWFREEPAAYLELTFRKLLLFWDFRELPNNVSIAFEGASSRLIRYAALPGGVVIFLGLAGMFLWAKAAVKKRSAGLGLLYGMVIFFWGANAAFYILGRFRAPVLPLLAVFGALGVVRIVRYRRRERIRFALPALACAGFLTFGAYDYYRNFCEAAVLRQVRPQGTRIVCRNGRIVRFDHGPETLGGWRGWSARSGEQVQKQFAVKPAERPASIEFTAAAEHAGILTVAVNGVPCTLDFAKAERQTGKVTLPEDAVVNGTVQFRILANTADAALLLDLQRDYGRTQLNGKPFPGELVARLTLAPDKHP